MQRSATQLTLNTKYKYARNLAFGSFAAFLIGGGIFLQPFSFTENTNAATHTDSASGMYDGNTYSLSTTVSDLNLTLDALPSGSTTYGAQTVSVTTNAPGGYQLYMQTSGNLASSVDSSTIPSITGTNVALDTNKWGYTTTAPDSDPSTAGTQSIWSAVPTTLTQVDSYSTTATNREKTLYYGVKADNTLTDGNYNGTITYTTIANDATTNTLSISPTTGTAGQSTTVTIATPLMTTTDAISASDLSVTIGSYSCTSISISSRAPLTFTCSVTPSAAGTYTVTTTISKYNKTYTKASAFTAKVPDLDRADMQSSNIATLCKNSAETTSTSDVHTYRVRDTRNSQYYYVRKFTFGSKKYCMMVENLYLTGGTQLTSAKSNVSSSYTLPSSTTSGYYENTTPQMYNGSRYAGSGNKDGSYYNWCAATAGTGGCYNINKTATGDICPKYWRLPTYSEQSNIASKITYSIINTFFAGTDGSTHAPIYAGYYFNSNSGYAGSHSYWWSGTQSSNDGAGGSRVYSGSLSTTSNYYKYIGMSVRCLVQAAS